MPAEHAGRNPRWRRGLAAALVAVAGLLLPVGLLAGWAHTTFYDSDTFSQRATTLLDSAAVRRELADQLTEHLALNGNRQAISFRPAFQLAIETAIDTDTFRSIFRNAVHRTHETTMAGGRKGTALDLSDSLSIIAGTLQLPDTAQPGQQDEKALGSSLTGVTDEMADLGVWRFEGVTANLTAAGIGGGMLAAALAIALARDRRRTMQRLGLVLLVDGLVLAGLVLATEWYVGRAIAEAELAAAVRAAVTRGMADLSSLGLWTAGYGVILAAAARAEGARRFTPARAAGSLAAWADRRRATTGGSVLLGAAAVAAGLLIIGSPGFWLRVAILGAGLWLVYFGAAELVTLVRAAVPTAGAEGGAERTRRRRLVVVGCVTIALLLVATNGAVIAARRAASGANAAGVQKCNGDESLCDLPLNLAVFPGSHNSMSGALYPGWLFAEHVKTIGGQLDDGVRALLVDTHYGVPSTARLPGSETPVILTDRAAELRHPVGADSDIDPAIAQRASELAGRAPPAANAAREIYLCHNYCELGAIRFADALQEIKTFLDHHPDDVVISVIQDATTPAETATAIEEAGLGERVWTLDPNRPLPTLGEMIRAGRTLLVFAENGGPGAPPWYHKAYESWFQETPYAFDNVNQMSCGPNRGPARAPLFLVNHWISASPPDPKLAGTANSRTVLEDRLRRCLAERGLVPNIVAVDFVSRGDLVETARGINDTLISQVRGARPGTQPSPAPTSTLPDGQSPEAPPAAASTSPVVPVPTPVTSLTGGDARAFCQRAPAALDVIGAWALAKVVTPPAQKGLDDLAYGPAAARAIDDLDGVAPVELAQLMAVERDRAHAGVQALRDLGLDQPAIDALADLAQSELSALDNPDPFAVQTVVLDRVRDIVGDGPLNAAGQAFTAAHPEGPGLFDLGEVPDDVARNSGYDCLVGPDG